VITAITIALFVIGWCLFVLVQMHNSVSSTSNGLQGASGYLLWLRVQAVNLVTRAFFSVIFYSYLVAQVTQKMNDVGFHATAYSAAGVAGYTACAGLYQVFGLLPWLRIEVGEVSPPQAKQ
jgi:hypothetical protein